MLYFIGKCLFLSGLTSEQFTAYEDFKMLDQGIGFTNIVARTTRGSADLSKKEIAEGIETVTYFISLLFITDFRWRNFAHKAEILSTKNCCIQWQGYL